MKLDKSADWRELCANEERAVNLLEGVRVVEIADEIAGPYCGKLFADLAPK